MQRQYITPDPDLGQAETVKNPWQNAESIKDVEKNQNSAKGKITLGGLGAKQPREESRSTECSLGAAAAPLPARSRSLCPEPASPRSPAPAASASARPLCSLKWNFNSSP